MSALLVILGFVGAITVIIARAVAVDEIKGRIQRRITASLEATIAALPNELQVRWAEEWRAELAAIITMPLTAAQFARGVRRSAHQLVANPALAPAGIENHAPTRRGMLQGPTGEWRQSALRNAQRVLRNIVRGGIYRGTARSSRLGLGLGLRVGGVVLVGGAVNAAFGVDVVLGGVVNVLAVVVVVVKFRWQR